MNEPELFLVRVWHPNGGFRASARRLEEEQPRLFLDPAELVRYFAAPHKAGDTEPALSAPAGVCTRSLK